MKRFELTATVTPRMIALSAFQLLLLSLLQRSSSCADLARANQDIAANSSSSSSAAAAAAAAANSSGVARQQQNLQLISNWLELVSANKRNESHQSLATGVALEVSPPPINSLFQYQPTASSSARRPAQPIRAPNSRQILVATAGRSARTPTASQADFEQAVDVFVSNVCERDFMLIKVKTSRPFYGVIHTLNYRRKPHCAIEGNGGTEFQLNISHALDSRDPQYCGVIRLTRGSATAGGRQPDEPDDGELLSVVLAIRMHQNVELSDDKFLVLNCTNRCRQLDCSSENSSRLASVSQQRPIEDFQSARQRQLERESEADIRAANSQDQRSWWERAIKRAGGQQQQQQQQQLVESRQQAGEACSVWQFPWLLALVVCLAILLAGCAISNCIICWLRSPSSSGPSDSHKSSDAARAQQQQPVKQHTIYYENEHHQPRHNPVDVASTGRARRSRSRLHLHERLPDRTSR